MNQKKFEWERIEKMKQQKGELEAEIDILDGKILELQRKRSDLKNGLRYFEKAIPKSWEAYKRRFSNVK
jgi:peptidoglycan hydrolase CwlO-like protein